MRICSLNPRRDEFSLRGGRFGQRVDRRSGRRRCLCKSSEPLLESENFWTFGRHFDASDLEVLLRCRWSSPAGNRVRGSRLKRLAYPQSLQFPFLYDANTSCRLDALLRLLRLLNYRMSFLRIHSNVSQTFPQSRSFRCRAEGIPIRTSTDEEADTIQGWMLLKEVDLVGLRTQQLGGSYTEDFPVFYPSSLCPICLISWTGARFTSIGADGRRPK